MKQQRRHTGRFWITLGLIFLVLVIAGAGGIYYYNLPAQKLQRAGYSKAETTIILENITEDDIAKALDFTNHRQLLEILQDSDFQQANFAKYLEYAQSFEFSTAEIIFLGNHEGARLLEIMQTQYYIAERLERYYNYLLAHPEPSAEEIIALVNAERDREFYDAPEKAQADGHLMLVNKYYYLEPDFAVDLVNMPAMYGAVGVQMERETYAAFLQMFQAALQAGVQLYVTSGYRGYNEQDEVYQSWVAQVGAEAAKNYAALPGFSEHQTGCAIDVFVPGQTTTSFAAHPAAKWLAENAHFYGFILRYPNGKEQLTGYDYEPWHFRYVGAEAATEIFERRLTLEEYVAYFGA